jgi:hypothetical protein
VSTASAQVACWPPSEGEGILGKGIEATVPFVPIGRKAGLQHSRNWF